MEPLNKGYLGDSMNSLVLVFVQRLSMSIREVIFLGPQAVSLLERSFILCPFLGGSIIGGFTVCIFAAVMYL